MAGIILLIVTVFVPPSPAYATTVGISADKFTLNGTPTFLLGASYFDTLGWKNSDLDQLAARKFNLIRIWLDWGVWTDRSRSHFDTGGNLVNPQMVLGLVRAAAQRGIVVDVTILNGCSVAPGCSSPQPFPDTATAEKAIRNAARLLKNESNVFFDLVNEHNESWSDSPAMVRQLVNAARSEAPARIMTVSLLDVLHVNDTTVDPAKVTEELSTGIDLLTPHLGRCPSWWDSTDLRVKTLKNYLLSINRNVPVYLQEESRRKGVNCGYEPTKANFLQAAKEARDAGAAGWVFHTDAGFDLSQGAFFDRLDSVERETVNELAASLGLGTPAKFPTPPYVTPTIYCLGSCPTFAPPSPPAPSTLPGNNLSPTGTVSTPPFISPVLTGTIPSVATPPPSPPAQGNLIGQIIQALLKLLETLLRLLINLIK